MKYIEAPGTLSTEAAEFLDPIPVPRLDPAEYELQLQDLFPFGAYLPAYGQVTYLFGSTAEERLRAATTIAGLNNLFLLRVDLRGLAAPDVEGFEARIAMILREAHRLQAAFLLHEIDPVITMSPEVVRDELLDWSAMLPAVFCTGEEPFAQELPAVGGRFRRMAVGGEGDPSRQVF